MVTTQRGSKRCVQGDETAASKSYVDAASGHAYAPVKKHASDRTLTEHRPPSGGRLQPTQDEALTGTRGGNHNAHYQTRRHGEPRKSLMFLRPFAPTVSTLAGISKTLSGFYRGESEGKAKAVSGQIVGALRPASPDAAVVRPGPAWAVLQALWAQEGQPDTPVRSPFSTFVDAHSLADDSTPVFDFSKFANKNAICHGVSIAALESVCG